MYGKISTTNTNSQVKLAETNTPLPEKSTKPIHDSGQNEEETPNPQKPEGISKLNKAEDISNPRGIETNKGSSRPSIMSAATIISTIQTDLKNTDLCPLLLCTGNNNTWVRTDHLSLKLMDKDGTSGTSVKMTSTVSVLHFVSQRNGNIISAGKNILPISKDGEFKTLFSVSSTSYGVCYLHSGDIVVAFGYKKRVIKYSQTGDVLWEFHPSLFSHPENMAQNKVNQHLYVCDKLDTSKMSFSSGRILAFDTDNKLLFMYGGHGGNSFTPAHVCSDYVGHILITDTCNDRVHILDENGCFMQYILTKEHGLYEPCSIDVDDKGHVWIGERYTGKVKVAQYLE